MRLTLALTPDPELDLEASERLSRRLRAELGELDVELIRLLPAEPPPDNAKGADPVTVGAIIVALSASGGVFTSLIDTVRAWLDRQSGRHKIAMTIDGDTIELERATIGQQQALVDTYIRRHSTD